MDGRLEDGLDSSISFGLFLLPFLRPRVLLTGGMEDGRIDEDGLDNSSTSMLLTFLPLRLKFDLPQSTIAASLEEFFSSTMTVSTNWKKFGCLQIFFLLPDLKL